MIRSKVDTASAIITRQFDLAEGGKVDIFVWKPEFIADGDTACEYLIVGLGAEKVRQGHGVDALQALELTLQAIGFHLYYSDAYKAGHLTWNGSRDLGLPTLPGEKPGGDAFLPAQLLTPASFTSVVVMPDQRFPYVAVPGERLHGLIVHLEAIMAAAPEGSRIRRRLTKLVKGLIGERRYYEAVCSRAGFQMSYIKSQGETRVE